MGDPLSIAAGVAGLVSLGIQTVQGLVDFYSSYKSRNTTIARTTDKLEALLGTLQTINQTLANRQFRADEKDVIVKIENSIQSCEDLISELQEEYEKLGNSSASGIRAAIRGAGRKLTYPFRESTLKKLDEDIGDIRENLSLSLDVLQLRSAHDLQNDLTDIKVLVNLVRESQVSNRIREWLRAPDATESHNQACAKRHPGTGLWLVKSPKFANWLDADKSFLWLNGFAGCGKTVLSSTAIQYTFRHRRSNPRIGIAFFYFSFSDAAKQDAAGMLRTLLLQLSNQLMDGHIALNRLYSNHIGGQPPLPALMESLRQVVNSFQDVYILVDALDESPRHKKRETVLDTLRDLRGWSVPGLHILVTSRDELDIRERLDTSNDEEIPMQNAEVDKDIADFVSQHLRQDWKMQKWSIYHDKIEQALVDRAKGVFRWVECQFTSLASCPSSEYHLTKALASLPPSLDETYARMIASIDPDSVEEAKRALTWLCFAKRPMTVEEIIDGLAVELEPSGRFNKARRLQNGNDILHICPGLITISTKERDSSAPSERETPQYVVHIAHFSVQEYLESTRILDQVTKGFRLQSQASNAELAQICLIYLLDPGLSRATLTPADLEAFPLAEYAATYWYKHIVEDEDGIRRVNALAIELLQGRRNAFLNCIRINDPEYPWRAPDLAMKVQEIPSPLYYASLLGLYHSVLYILKSPCVGLHLTDSQRLTVNGVKYDVNVQGGKYGNALQAASWRGYETIVKLLLNNGADINIQGGAYGNALRAASAGGHKTIVELLLNNGTDINAQGGDYGNALQAASAGGHETIVELLLNNGADIDAQGGAYGNALQAASTGGHKTIVELLLNNDADINAQGGTYGNALQAASAGGYKTIVELLLNNGADINAQGGAYGNALQAASARGHETIVELLLNNGADINAQGGAYGNALQAASTGGHKTIVELLLNNGANINAQGGKYGNALQAASMRGHETIVELLLNNGADINTQGGAYGNALQAASARDHKTIMQLLLSNSQVQKEET